MEIIVFGDDKYGETVSEVFESWDELEAYLSNEHGQVWYHPDDQARIVKELKVSNGSEWEGNQGYIAFEVLSGTNKHGGES